MNALKLVLAALAISLLGLAAPAAAGTPSAVRLEPPVRKVATVKVTYVQPAKGNRIWVEFNTGSLWSVAPCKYEDSNNCYWDADKRGNGRGTSFVVLKGKTYRTNLI